MAFHTNPLTNPSQPPEAPDFFGTSQIALLCPHRAVAVFPHTFDAVPMRCDAPGPTSARTPGCLELCTKASTKRRDSVTASRSDRTEDLGVMNGQGGVDKMEKLGRLMDIMMMDIMIRRGSIAFLQSISLTIRFAGFARKSHLVRAPAHWGMHANASQSFRVPQPDAHFRQRATQCLSTLVSLV